MHILIICAEASGDLNAGGLAKALKELNPQIKISAVGGPVLAKAGADIFYGINGLSVIGFFDALKKLPRFFALRKLILGKIRREKPEAIILVDFSGFNLRLAKKINKAIPVFYYVSPQVWASRRGRLKTIKDYIHKMIPLFRFEEEFLKRYGIDAVYAGHPLLDTVRPSLEKSDFCAKLGLCASNTILACLPGSRSAEIKFILPVMLKSARLLKKEIRDAQFIIAKSPQVDNKVYQRIIRRFPDIQLKITENMTYDCLNAADFSLIASGTATIEAAIIQKPFCIIYKMGILNYMLYRPLIKIPFIGMVNIVAGEKIVEEFIQLQATPEKISRHASEILKDPQKIRHLELRLAQVKSLLGPRNASLRAANIILDYLKNLN
jgi:lipid-A-disaccharide synthase